MAFVGRTDVMDPGAQQHQFERLAQRRERLYAEDAQFRDTRPDEAVAEAVRVLFNLFHQDAPTVVNVTVNGHAHAVPWPYPERQGFTWRTFAVSIPITDLVPGTNAVTIGADQTITTTNIDIVLVNAGAQTPPSTPKNLRVVGVSSTK